MVRQTNKDSIRSRIYDTVGETRGIKRGPEDALIRKEERRDGYTPFKPGQVGGGEQKG